LSVSLAVLGFVVSTLNIAGRARREDAIVSNGAPTVATLAAWDLRHAVARGLRATA
jgi:hypothetical protein